MSKTVTETGFTKQQILDDYKTGWQSRNLSITGRKEVLTGKAKFGIFGDGKEVPQLVLARFFEKGDWRSGYYRDQTLMLATGMFSMDEFFHQLYGSTDIELNPSNGGRSFNNHFGSRIINEKGEWVNQLKQKNTAADLSPTAGQMPRSIGLALASKLYRKNKDLAKNNIFSNMGNEVTFASIGDASTSEGHFFEIINAAGVVQVPLVINVWDDGYGISVEKSKQTTKASISEALKGFEKKKGTNGILIYKARGWNYPELVKVYREGIAKARKDHIPVLFHIEEITQPQGHSTSGSHERYKSKERLKWEQEYDGLRQMRKWIIDEKIATAKELDTIEKITEEDVKKARLKAWKTFRSNINKHKDALLEIVQGKSCQCKIDNVDKLSILGNHLEQIQTPIRRDITSTARKLLRFICSDCPSREIIQEDLKDWIAHNRSMNYEQYSSSIYSENNGAVLLNEAVAPEFNNETEEVPGRLIIRDNFDALFRKHPNLVAFGEDVGKIGGVNQTYEGLQEKYGEHRIFDTGIRETSIIGKGIGLALRGFRPIAEIQYLDYLLYGLQTLSDDLATLHWRTAAGQSAPLIVSTRGHRLEGIWHAGSPIGMIINALRGIYLCVPRDMTQAAGFYNMLLEGNDPAIVIEPLNGYRLKENKPKNLGEYKIPLGTPEFIHNGDDITVITYGSSVRVAHEAVKHLEELDIHVDLIDVQTLLPFDINEVIVESLKKTNKIIFMDEDVPGGASAYMMQKVLEEQGGFEYLELAPRTLTGRDHRPAYTSDGDYYSNPIADDLFEMAYEMMREVSPAKFPELF
jgi:pyruvate/2-oxoglutarate/acetoin dehydrogenase E1 component/TPP-dependent pyruvate/acetoin dehydrogenase alpha subunit